MSIKENLLTSLKLSKRLDKFCFILFIVIALVLTYRTLTTESKKQVEVRKQREEYERGWRDGWKNKVDHEVCLLSGKFALESVKTIPKFYGCIPIEDSKGYTGSYLTDEPPK